MKQRTLGVALLAIWLAATAATAAPDKPPVRLRFGYVKGNNYRQFPEVMKRGYLMGVVDGFYYAPAFGGQMAETDWLDKCLNGWVDTQLMAVVDKWLAKNPSRWHEPMHLLTHTALTEACP